MTAKEKEKYYFDKKEMVKFGKFETLVTKWCIKHKMYYVMPEFVDLFNWIEAQAKLEELRGLVEGNYDMVQIKRRLHNLELKHKVE